MITVDSFVNEALTGALTDEQKTALASLTDAQKAAIAVISEKDEGIVIGNRFGEVYRQLDKTIAENTGIERNGDEKTYNYLARATKELKDKYGDYDELKGKVTTLTSDLAEARKGSEEAIKSATATVQKELDAVRSQYDALKAEKEKLEETHKTELEGIRIDAEFAKAIEGVNFKKGLNDSALVALRNQAVSNVKKNNPSFEERDGQKVLVFHDAEGAPLLNAQNSAKPYTVKELLTKEFETLGILETKKTSGAGGKGDDPKHTSGFSTQVEARDAIIKELASKGFVNGTPEYREEKAKLWEEYEVDKLPLEKE